jgi:hypothetical protein
MFEQILKILFQQNDDNECKIHMLLHEKQWMYHQKFGQCEKPYENILGYQKPEV